jgi:hypothetical protein
MPIAPHGSAAMHMLPCNRASGAGGGVIAASLAALTPPPPKRRSRGPGRRTRPRTAHLFLQPAPLGHLGAQQTARKSWTPTVGNLLGRAYCRSLIEILGFEKTVGFGRFVLFFFTLVSSGCADWACVWKLGCAGRGSWENPPANTAHHSPRRRG